MISKGNIDAARFFDSGCAGRDVRIFARAAARGYPRRAAHSRRPLPASVAPFCRLHGIGRSDVLISLFGEQRLTDYSSLSAPELAHRIAILRDNIRQLTEQAAAQSGAANEERIADRLAAQNEELDGLLREQSRRARK
jgi:uncharacterized small protein (DUF1192 family)